MVFLGWPRCLRSFFANAFPALMSRLAQGMESTVWSDRSTARRRQVRLLRIPRKVASTSHDFPLGGSTAFQRLTNLGVKRLNQHKIVAVAHHKARSSINSARPGGQCLYPKYQRMQRTMISRSQCRPSDSGAMALMLLMAVCIHLNTIPAIFFAGLCDRSSQCGTKPKQIQTRVSDALSVDR